MTQWEYIFLRADWFSGGLRAFSPDTKKPIPLDTYLNELGAQGWEVVAMQHLQQISEVGKLVFVLKRPKPQI